jgi:hypothetical protein
MNGLLLKYNHIILNEIDLLWSEMQQAENLAESNVNKEIKSMKMMNTHPAYKKPTFYYIEKLATGDLDLVKGKRKSTTTMAP